MFLPVCGLLESTQCIFVRIHCAFVNHYVFRQASSKERAHLVPTSDPSTCELILVQAVCKPRAGCITFFDRRIIHFTGLLIALGDISFDAMGRIWKIFLAYLLVMRCNGK